MTNEVSPQLFFDAAMAYERTAAIKAAIDLDLFTALAKGPMTAAELATVSSASERGIRILCDVLTSQGFLEKDQSKYNCTPSSRLFLDRASPAYVGAATQFLTRPELTSAFLGDFTGIVRNGGPIGPSATDPENPLWVEFAESMAGLMAPIASAVAEQVAAWPKRPAKVLDVAAGHGLYGIALAKAIPETTVAALDWAGVLAVAERNARSAGVLDRYSKIAGDAFKVEWGRDYDLILFPNFLHHFSFEECVELLKKARASLAAGGRALAIDFVPDESRVAPPIPASFALVMLAMTPKGDVYTASQLSEMARAVGFPDATVSPLAQSPASLVVIGPA